MSRLLVLGDPHGAHRAMVQCFERAQVDREQDALICLGDVADGWSEVRECFDELLTFKKLIYVLGNHDDWARQWMRVGACPPQWTSQGGFATIKSYGGNAVDRSGVPRAHLNLLNHAKYWHQDKRRIFVHGGWPLRDSHPIGVGSQTLMWDRTMWKEARRRHEIDPETRLTRFDAVFIGHTATAHYSYEPVKACEIWNVDQGAGWLGRLTLMDVDSGEYWQSDNVQDLYGDTGRAKWLKQQLAEQAAP